MKSALPMGWTTIRLGDLGAWKGGGTPSKARADYWEHGTIPWVSPKDMKVSVVRGAEDRITETAIAGSSTSLVEAGAVLVVVRSGILRHTLPVAVTAVDVTLNQDMKALVPSGAASPEYVAWALRRFESQILQTCTRTGTTVQNVSFPMFSKFEIPLPPLAEQRRIVAAIEEHLSRLDAAVAGLERVNALLPRYRAAVLKAAVEGGNGNSLTEWKEWSVGELGKVVTGGTPPTGDRSNYDGIVPFFKPSDLDLGYWSSRTRDHVSSSAASRLRQIPPMTVMVTCIGATLGKIGLARVGGITNQQINSVIVEAGNDPRFIYYWFSSPTGQHALWSNASATTLPILNKTKFSQIQIRAPYLEEQVRLVEEIDRCESIALAATDTVNAINRRAAALRQSILARAFRGELVPQDPSDEPAEVLLERIRAERGVVGSARKTARGERKLEGGRV